MSAQFKSLSAMLNQRGRFVAVSPDGKTGKVRLRLGTAMRDCVYGHADWAKPQKGLRISVCVRVAASYFPDAVDASWTVRQVRK